MSRPLLVQLSYASVIKLLKVCSSQRTFTSWTKSNRRVFANASFYFLPSSFTIQSEEVPPVAYRVLPSKFSLF